MAVAVDKVVYQHLIYHATLGVELKCEFAILQHDRFSLANQSLMKQGTCIGGSLL